MEMDLVLACLLVLLGAIIAYAIDEQFRFTDRIASWIGQDPGE